MEGSRQGQQRLPSSACHPVTGLAPEYAHYDGTPITKDNRHRYYSDSYRVAANIGMDFAWFGVDEEQRAIADRIQTFFCKTAKGKLTGYMKLMVLSLMKWHFIL